MSTRATILIKSKKENEEVRIYHNCDGYPDGIGSDMKRYLKSIGFWDVYEIANDLIKGKCGMVGTHPDDGYELTYPDDGYELTSCQHGDEEYAYLIDCDSKTLTCYEVGWDEFDWKDENIVDIPD